MLLKGKAETIEYPKLATMLEATLESDLDKFPSPRLLNSHLPLRMLPKQLKGKYRPQRQKTYHRTCVSSVDSGQPAHSLSLIRIQYENTPIKIY